MTGASNRSNGSGKTALVVDDSVVAREKIASILQELGCTVLTASDGLEGVKLAKELARRATGKTFYILDEPTTGLHFEDTRKLLEVLQELVEAGNTIVVIEHNLEVIKTADWIIDLGPEGGHRGGELVAAGTPEEICKVEESYTGQFLKNYLGE